MVIEPLRMEDIPAVLEIEADALTAWNREHLEDELHQLAGFQFVARGAGKSVILAVLCGRLVADEAEILKLTVARSARRKGIGSSLLDFALKYCKTRGAKNCFLELRSSNITARKLYEKQGFFIAGVRRGYYDKPREDAILMQLEF